MTQPRMCEACGLKPQAYHDRRFCYDCKPPTFKGWPRPCRRCGSKQDYYTKGLCRRCHQYAPQRPEPCRDCDAWPVFRIRNWLCGGCHGWRRVNPTLATCIGCRRDRPVNPHRACRLCWRQAKLLRKPGDPLDVVEANRYGQQLFFANMHATNHRHDRPPMTAAQGVRLPSTPRSRAKPFHQLTLRPVPIVGPARNFGFPDPPDTDLAGRLDRLVRDHARRYGWSNTIERDARLGMRVLLGMCKIETPPVLASDVERLIALDLPARSVRAVLTEAGMLDDDRTAAIERWFDRHVAGLPPTMTGELRIWFDILYRGSKVPPRRRPRSPITIKTNLIWALPTLRAWAGAGHESLREITREEVLKALPGSGTPRATVGHGLRSIFTTLKARKEIFANPTTRVDFGHFERRIPLPADMEKLREAIHSDDPSRAALAALVTFHGLRPVEVRDLQHTDVRDGRVHLADRTLPLADPVRERLARYLAYRRSRWPNSVNPHFFIHYLNAPTTEPVSRIWVNKRLGISAQALRQDRIIEEAIATNGDVRQMSEFFGVTVATAIYYTTALDPAGLADTTPADYPTSSPTEGFP